MSVIDVTERPVLKLGPDLFRFAYPDGIASGSAVGTAQVNATVVASGVAAAGAVGTVQANASVTADGISAGTGALGSPALVAFTSPGGISGGATAGSVQANTVMKPTGVASTSALGATTAFTSMNPSGFASTGAVGTAKTRAFIDPTGIAGSVGFGDADTIATVFIIPGPVDPSNDFGTVNVIRKGWLFRTPRTTYQWRMFKEYEGVSLLREDGVWSEVQHPDLERTRAAQQYLGGGRDHFVDDTTKAELVALGYTVTEEIIP